MSQVIDLGDADLKKKVDDLISVEGFCLMVDIVKSTELKDLRKEEWILRMADTFNLVRSWVEPKFLKTVGDMLMFWFRDVDYQMTIMPDLLIRGLAGMFREAKKEPQHSHPVKAAVCRCSGVFEISFMTRQEDVYGKDIDLTARLLNLADGGEVVMNEGFYDILRRIYAIRGSDDESGAFQRIQGPWSQKIKSFDKRMPIYKLPAFP